MALTVLEGALEREAWHRPDKYNPGTMTFGGTLDDGSFVIGPLRKPVVGASYRFWGRWQNDPRYGRRFFFKHVEALADKSPNGIAQLLEEQVTGIGKVKARAIVEHFGADTLDILRTDPERAGEVGGITPELIDNLRNFFESNYGFDPAAYARLLDLFEGQRFPKRIVDELLAAFNSAAPDVITEHPYILMHMYGIGWTRADSFAVNRVKFDRNGIERQQAAIMEALEKLAQDGHTYGRRAEIEGVGTSLLGYRPCEDAWIGAFASGKVIRDREDNQEIIALASLDAAERSIAEQITILAEAADPLPFSLVTDDMNDDQKRAAEIIGRHGVVILAGAPGVGKSWTTAKVVEVMDQYGLHPIVAAAPTGKAAKRFAELLAHADLTLPVPSSTIHKMLMTGGSTEEDEDIPASKAKRNRGRDEYEFRRNGQDPVPARIMIIDELSMCDVRLFSAVLNAIRPGTRLLLVGDPNQLPSVGPGAVLRDLIVAGVPSITLSKIVRSQPGRIIEACHAILKGQTPRPAPELGGLDGDRTPIGGDNWIHIEVNPKGGGESILGGPREIADIIVDFHVHASNFDPLWEIQVISAQKDLAYIGCEPLNRRLSAMLNPETMRGIEAMEEHDALPPFFKGDKVVRTKNGQVDLMVPAVPIGETAAPFDGDDRVCYVFSESEYDLMYGGRGWKCRSTYVVNGDMGQVLDIQERGRGASVIVRFDNPRRYCRLNYGQAELMQAYALTCHKCQGSGFPVVIVPVHPSFYWDERKQTGLFSRELVYTAISRAEKILITVGEFESIRRAIGRKTLHQRRTRLARRIAETMNREVVQVGR